MEKMICKGCGSNDLYKENGYLVCRYCGTRHLIAKEDGPEKESVIDLNEDVARLLKRWDEDPSRADKYAHMILEIDPHNQRALQQVRSKSSSGGCYVATAVYGSYDCPQVWTLRRFRDDTLAETWYGRFFISTYYAVSPTMVKWFGRTEWFRGMWKPVLDKMVARLNREGIADTPYNDRNW
jgi:uncharacterized Zn finger protein (UPF0148 family)